MSELQPLKNYCDETFKFSLELDEGSHCYKVDTQRLRSFARYMGFSQVKILSMDSILRNTRTNIDAFSRVHQQTSDDAPLKAQWYSIEIYINQTRLREKDREKNYWYSINQEVNELIAREIRAKATQHFTKLSPSEFFTYDAVPISIISTILYLLQPEIYSNLSSNETMALIGAILLARALIFNTCLKIETKDSEGSRISLFDGIEIERFFVAAFSQKTHYFSQVCHKSG